MKIKCFFLLTFFIAFNAVLNAQTVTNAWATLVANAQPAFIVMDASNNVYVSNKNNSTISKITPNGTLTLAWATLGAGTDPYGMVIDASGNLYTINRNAPSYTISKITPSSDGSRGTVIQTWASIGSESYTIAIDASGNLYIPSIKINRIAKVVPAAGGASGTVTFPWATLASGANPFSITFDAAGNLYSANSNNTISKITPSGTVTQAWASLATNSNPQLMTFDLAGNLYVSCWNSSTVSKVSSIGTVTNVFSLGTDTWPAGIVSDAYGNIFIANYNANKISKIASDGTVTQSYITLTSGSNPFHLAKDATGNIYSTNMGNATVSKISMPNISITSSASSAVCGTNVTFTATASNIVTPSYQWYKNGIAITGATSSTYSTTALINNDQINVLCGTLSSTSITITITSPNAIITVNGDACVNKTTLTSPTGFSSYAWYKDNVLISGATSNTYTPTASGDYQVQVSIGTCSSTSTSTTIYTCGKNPDGKMVPITSSTLLVSSIGQINSKNGVDESGLILIKPFINTPTGNNPITTGLVLYLDATRPASYGGSGTTWNDLSGLSNTAILVDGPKYGSGNILDGSGSFTFSGTNYATTSKNNISLSAATFIAWINPSSIQGGLTGIIFNRNTYFGSTAPATGLDFSNSNSIGYHWNDEEATYNWNSNLSVPINTWSLIALTITSTTATVYLFNANSPSGSYKSNTTTHAQLSGLNFIIGNEPGGPDRAFIGKIATAMVYTTELSAADITSIFNVQKASFGL